MPDFQREYEEDSHEHEETVTLGLFKLQEWLMELYQRKIAYQDDDGVICVYPEVAERFALGLKDDCAYVVMPPMEMAWASVLAWSHAAMREGKPTLFLVAQTVEIGGIETPPFGMSFTIANSQLSKALENHATLELRCFKKVKERIGVSQECFTSMPLVVIEENGNAFDALKSRKPDNDVSHGYGRGR